MGAKINHVRNKEQQVFICLSRRGKSKAQQNLSEVSFEADEADRSSPLAGSNRFQVFGLLKADYGAFCFILGGPSGLQGPIVVVSSNVQFNKHLGLLVFLCFVGILLHVLIDKMDFSHTMQRG